MARIINLHVLQSVPASLLNRDDNNSAKAITIGNVRRDRISSQSWKRAVRTSMRTTTIDGAAGYSHPFGVTPTTVEPDFFTAVDDCAADGEAVSGNLGVTDLTAPLLYRHAYLDVDQLEHNLEGTDHLVTPAIDAFIRHTTLAVPTAKARSAASHTRPDILVATIGEHALSAANAYTQPVLGEEAVSESINRLTTQLDYDAKLVNHTTIILPLSTAAAEAVNHTEATVVDTLDEFITAVNTTGANHD